MREWGGGVALWVVASCDKASLISEFGELWGDEWANRQRNRGPDIRYRYLAR